MDIVLIAVIVIVVVLVVAAIALYNNLVKLRKRGRMLVASYEAIRFQKLDLFGVMLRQIGAHIQKQQLADAVYVTKHEVADNP
mgnify:CR=1 FL=1